MSRFNRKKVSTITTINEAAGVAYKESPELALVSLLLTSFVKDDFYRSEQAALDQLKLIVHQMKDKKFAAQAAIFARTKFGMRSITHVLAAELAILDGVKGQSWTRNFYDKIVYRVDDMSEILSYLVKKYGNAVNGNDSRRRPIPNAVKAGFKRAFNRFDNYQISKYPLIDKDFSLIDLVNLIHPKPTEKNNEALNALIRGRLIAKVDTWEKALSDAGRETDDEDVKTELKNTAWKEMINSKKIGYFALLKNLRNILSTGDNELIEKACALLVDENLIAKSLVLPFRYLVAREQIDNLSSSKITRFVLSKIDEAIDIACKNVPKFDGETLVAFDDSGSMGQLANSRSPFAIGSLFSAALVKSSNADFVMFSDHARFINLNSRDSISTCINVIEGHRTSNGTNFNAIFELITAAKRKYDRIIILSDQQGWMAPKNSWTNSGGAPTKTFTEYKRITGADPKIFSFDLAGLGTLQFPEKNVYAIAGFSDKVFSIMKLLEEDRDALINEIKKVEI